jgi:hypothetical protein
MPPIAPFYRQMPLAVLTERCSSLLTHPLKGEPTRLLPSKSLCFSLANSNSEYSYGKEISSSRPRIKEGVSPYVVLSFSLVMKL